jgi:hypothetical protein
MEDLKKRRFLWGMLLAWSSLVALVPLLYGFYDSFQKYSEQKATGLGAVAGGLAEAFLSYGLLLAAIAQLTAILHLVRGFSLDSTGRTVLSVVSICWSLLTLLLIGSTVWLLLKMPH